MKKQPLNEEFKRMQKLAGLTENKHNLENIDDETIKNKILQSIQTLINKGKISNGIFKIDAEDKSDFEYDLFTDIYGVEYNDTNTKEADDKLENITTLTNQTLTNQDNINKILLTFYKEDQ